MQESIVVIGSGPGGMFYCHALETKRRQLQEQGKSVEELPIVTVLERASTPGGVWRSGQRHAPATSSESELTGLRQSTQMVSFRSESIFNDNILDK